MKISKQISDMIGVVFKHDTIKNKNIPIIYLSTEFVEVAMRSKDKLEKLCVPEILDIKDCEGIYIFMDSVTYFGYGNDNSAIVESINYKTFETVKSQHSRNAIAYFIMLITLFKKYAEVETKILPPKSKQGKTIKCKYINQTDYQITYLNSTWFTNLVKSDAFKVSGHFRLQPCHDENGLPTKKLIWISDFVKSGYTAPARKLKETIS